MKLTRYIGLVVWPTIFTAYLLAVAAAAALPWLPASLGLPETWSLLAAAGAAGIVLWLLAFWVLRRRYVWATDNPEREAPPLHAGQWLEVGLGGLAVGTAAGLGTYAAANLVLGGLEAGDARLGPIAALAGVATVIAGWAIRGAARRANRRSRAVPVGLDRPLATATAAAAAPPAEQAAGAAPAADPASATGTGANTPQVEAAAATESTPALRETADEPERPAGPGGQVVSSL